MLANPAPRVLAAGLFTGALAAMLLVAGDRREPGNAPGREAPRSGEASAQGRAVQAQMENVDYRVIPAAVLNIRRLRGELHSKDPGKPPVFDDKESFLLKIHSAEIGMTEQSMAGLFNEHVFAYPGSPLERIEVRIEPDHVIQKGVLRKALKIPFSIVGTISLTPEGEIRVHPTAIRAAGIGVRRLMEILGLELEKLIKLWQDRGVRIAGNDFLISADRMLPPPQIQGTVTAVRLEKGRIVLTFDSPGKPRKSPPLAARQVLPELHVLPGGGRSPSASSR